MEKKYFPLEPKENSRLTMIFQVIFGILCIAVALYWAIFQFASLKADSTMWITIVFLVGFGAYQVAAGFGKIKKFIEIGSDRITLKRNSFLPKTDIKSTSLEKIEIYPLSICFCLNGKKKMILRFGLSYTDIINPVKDAIAEFAGLNGISVEEKKEEL
jgi:hypothetical protein